MLRFLFNFYVFITLIAILLVTVEQIVHIIRFKFSEQYRKQYNKEADDYDNEIREAIKSFNGTVDEKTLYKYSIKNRFNFELTMSIIPLGNLVIVYSFLNEWYKMIFEN